MVKEGYILKDYICPWCGHQFETEIRYVSDFHQGTFKKKKKAIISSQVSCPKCSRNIPTFKKEETGNINGRKHIHLR